MYVLYINFDIFHGSMTLTQITITDPAVNISFIIFIRDKICSS